jgi:dehydrogenase/reductase SDR family protein 1
LGLGGAGATVYVTGRSTRKNPGALPGTIEDTADEVTEVGGRGIAVHCDHRVDAEVEALFARIRGEAGRLDLLVNNAFASPEQRVLWSGEPFWQVPVSLWDSIMDVGLRSPFVATRLAAPMMIEQRAGLVINVASRAAVTARTDKSRSIIPYSVGKAAVHHMTQDMAADLRTYGVAVISLWPPATKTEAVLAQPEVFGDLSEWREPIFTGTVVAAFVATVDPLAHAGQALAVEQLAAELGVSP